MDTSTILGGSGIGLAGIAIITYLIREKVWNSHCIMSCFGKTVEVDIHASTPKPDEEKGETYMTPREITTEIARQIERSRTTSVDK